MAVSTETINGNITEWGMGNTEVGFVSQDCSSNGTLLLHIPKLMPAVPFGTPKITPVPLSASIFINDEKCKPKPPKTINTQNYLTVPRQEDRFFKRATLKKGSRILVEVQNGNPDGLRVSTKEDPSTGAWICKCEKPDCRVNENACKKCSDCNPCKC